MGAAVSVEDARTAPTSAEVVEAEAKALEAGRSHIDLVMRAKALRLAHTFRSEPERIGLRVVNSDISRFMKADKEQAMAKYDEYADEVRRRLCPGYRLPDEDAGWQVVDAEAADVYLQKLDGGAGGGADARAPAAAYTVTSVFGTRYDSLLADGEQLVFRNMEDFLVRFPSGASLDMMIENAAEGGEDDDDEEEAELEGRLDDDEDEEGEVGKLDDAKSQEAALRKDALRLVSDRVWREDSRRAEARARDEKEKEEE